MTSKSPLLCSWNGKPLISSHIFKLYLTNFTLHCEITPTLPVVHLPIFLCFLHPEGC